MVMVVGLLLIAMVANYNTPVMATTLVHIRMYVCTCVRIIVYVCTYVCMYVCM